MILRMICHCRAPMALLIAVALFQPTLSQAQDADHPVLGQAQGGSKPTMLALIQEFEADDMGLGQFYNLPWSPVRFDRLEKHYKEWLTRLDRVDFDALDQSGRVDFLLLHNEMKQSLGSVTNNRKRLQEMDELVPFRSQVIELERARWRVEPVVGDVVATKVDDITRQVKLLCKRVEKGKRVNADSGGKDASTENSTDQDTLTVSASMALRAAEASDSFRNALKRWFAFYDGYQPDFSWWVKKSYDEAIHELDDYSKLLREEVAGQKGKDEDALVGDPIGGEALAEAIRSEFLPYTAEELIAIGEREMAWCEQQMKAASNELGYGDDWKKALEQVKLDFVPPGQQDDYVAKVAREGIAFTREHQFATIPPLCEETWRLTMMSPETMKVIPYAAYGGQQIMVAYAKDEMTHEDKLMAMRGNNRHFTRLTTAHELIPGHHLQSFQAERHHPQRNRFSTPFYVEGWALYCELRFWELGWASTPEDRIGMLFWRMHRAARIIVSLKFHLGLMKPQEMIDYLIDRVGHEKLGATSEVRRFIGGDYSPLYQAGYMLGGLQLHALHDEMVGPDKLTERQFNDAVLMENTMPIELLRAALLNLPLTRDTKPTWKFAGENPLVK